MNEACRKRYLFRHMPEQDFYGVDTFTYTATDGIDTTDPVLVTINVIPVNDAPVAVNDIVDATEDVASVLPILANDKDVDDVLSTAMRTTFPFSLIRYNGRAIFRRPATATTTFIRSGR